MVDLNIAQVVVVAICVIGVSSIFYHLLRRNKCEMGGFCDWYDKEDYQFTKVRECRKCREKAIIDKVKI